MTIVLLAKFEDEAVEDDSGTAVTAGQAVCSQPGPGDRHRNRRDIRAGERVTGEAGLNHGLNGREETETGVGLVHAEAVNDLIQSVARDGRSLPAQVPVMTYYV